ncbi:MAG: type III secretion system export apparatus subunit SctU [Deltaproteobacteria bacterium]|jgi:type III secretion protein U|nr:type III secretion system export apparatus subunit SctU [Deltaproteobacteria bacterium]
MSEKTEQPTPKRLREAREKGQVCKSQEVGATAVLLSVFGVFLGAGSFIWEALLNIFETPLRAMHLPYDVALPNVAGTVCLLGLQIVLVVLGTAICAGLAANLIQYGVLISMKAAMPKLDKLNPSQWFKKTFALKNVVELVKIVAKTLVMAIVVSIAVEDNLGLLLSIPYSGIGGIAPVAGNLFAALISRVAPVFLAVAALDYFFQRRQYIKGLKMSKDEVKREYKEMEGDPQIKGKRKQLHQEMAMSNTLANVRKAQVVVTNPTHVAVALFYDDKKTPLPIIAGMGEGLLARRIVEIAKEEGIPIMRNVPLARALLQEGAENEYIPSDLIRQVAEVLRWAQTLKDR